MSLFVPRDYQESAASDAIGFLRTAGEGARRLFAGPCGIGKSIIELMVKAAFDDCWIITPKKEIIAGLLEKSGVHVPSSDDALTEAGFAHRIATPIMLRNRMLLGRGPDIGRLIIDESHHETAETYQQIDALTGSIPAVGYTATPYRGTPAGTAELRKRWGEPSWILTYPEAVRRGVITLPSFRTVPVLDDDIVEVTNGEFNVRKLDKATPWQHAYTLVSDLWRARNCPTIVCLPSVWACQQLGAMLDDAGTPCCVVTGDTPHSARTVSFRRCVAGEAVLLQVAVVSEGVDLPLRRLIDLGPTLSPVKWLQLLGRIMRPGGESEYICTNRNLLRHGYLLDGLVPTGAFIEAQEGFETKTSKRGGIRAFGLEGVGKLKPCEVPLANGMTASAYYVSTTEGHRVTQYAAIVLPDRSEVLWAKRCNERGEEGTQYGRWTRCDPPSELRGFASVPPRPWSPKQEQWWKNKASSHGLDPEAEVNAKSFSVLPVLSDLRLRIA